MIFKLVIDYLGYSIPDNSEVIVIFAFNNFILLLVLLFTFFNIFGYFISIMLINKLELRTKYPSLSKLIDYYSKTTIFFFVFDFIFFIVVILSLMYASYDIFIEYIN